MEEKSRDIPKEKFVFVNAQAYALDKTLSSKPRGYILDAFSRFCKNKGAIVGGAIIFLLILFAVFAPFATPYGVRYMDSNYKSCFPKNKLFKNVSFWDGCEKRADNEDTFYKYYAMGMETGYPAVKKQEYELKDGLYIYRLDSVHKVGAKYLSLTMEEYEALQKYQDENDAQVIYPTVALKDRPQTLAGNTKNDANYYFKTAVKGNKVQIVYDAEGNIIPVYASYPKGQANDYYHSKMRIEGEDGFLKDGINYYYAYARPISAGVEVRVNYYEYYKYYHSSVAKDGIEEPSFLFGTTSDGQDVFTCLFSGARFSLLFGLAVAVVNLLVGGLYGAIAGFYGGKIDLIMERISDILSAIPSMIVITLLRWHLNAPSAVILFVAFFATGWIGMAGRTRMQFYRYKNQEYVLASRTLGASDRRLIFKHIFPNAIGTLVTSFALVIPSMIYTETNLTYLGIINLSDSNLTTVGTLIANGQANLTTATFISLFPAIFLALLMLGFNLFGNGLRDAFNPSLKGAE